MSLVSIMHVKWIESMFEFVKNSNRNRNSFFVLLGLIIG